MRFWILVLFLIGIILVNGCVQNNFCDNIKCESNEKCVDGSCQLLSCSDQGGKLCLDETVCKTKIVPAFDTNQCCTSSCEQQINMNIVNANLADYSGFLFPTFTTPNNKVLVYVKNPNGDIKSNLFLKIIDSKGTQVKTTELFNDGEHGDFDPGDYIAGDYITVKSEGFYTFQICSDVNGPCSDLPLVDLDDQRLEVKDVKCLSLFEDHNIRNADRINMVLIGSGYENVEVFKNISRRILSFDGDPINTRITYDKAAGKLVNYTSVDFGFFSVEPLKSNKNKFNVWYLSQQLNGSLKDFSRKVSDQDGNQLSFCNLDYVYPAFIINGEFNPHDSVDGKGGSRSNAEWPSFVGDKIFNKSSLRFGISLNSFPIFYGIQTDWELYLPDYYYVGGYELLLHESGHALFGLQDEYTETQLQLTQPNHGYPNCAANLSEAREWWGDRVGEVDPFYYEFRKVLEGNNMPVLVESDRSEDNIKIDFVKGGCGLESGSEGAYKPTLNSMMRDEHITPVFGSVNRARADQILNLFSGN